MDARKWLYEYRDAAKNAELLAEQAIVLRRSVCSPNTAQLTGMPRGGGNRVDLVGGKVVLLEKVEKQLEEARAYAERLLDERLTAIDQIVCRGWAEKRAVLRLRYLEGLQWGDVNEVLYGTRDTFADHIDSHLKHCHVLHRAALAELEKVLQNITAQGG